MRKSPVLAATLESSNAGISWSDHAVPAYLCTGRSPPSHSAPPTWAGASLSWLLLRNIQLCLCVHRSNTQIIFVKIHRNNFYNTLSLVTTQKLDKILWYVLKWPQPATTTWRISTTEHTPYQSQSTPTRCFIWHSNIKTIITGIFTIISLLHTRQPWSRSAMPWEEVRPQYVICCSSNTSNISNQLLITELLSLLESMSSFFLLLTSMLLVSQSSSSNTAECPGREPSPSMFLTPVNNTSKDQLGCQDWAVIMNSSSRPVLTTVIQPGITAVFPTFPVHIPCNNNNNNNSKHLPLRNLWHLPCLLTAVLSMILVNNPKFLQTVNLFYQFILTTSRSVAVSQPVLMIGRSSLLRATSLWRMLEAPPRECWWMWDQAVAWQDPPDPVPDSLQQLATSTTTIKQSLENCLLTPETPGLVLECSSLQCHPQQCQDPPWQQVSGNLWDITPPVIVTSQLPIWWQNTKARWSTTRGLVCQVWTPLLPSLMPAHPRLPWKTITKTSESITNWLFKRCWSWSRQSESWCGMLPWNILMMAVSPFVMIFTTNQFDERMDNPWTSFGDKFDVFSINQCFSGSCCQNVISFTWLDCCQCLCCAVK